MYGDISLNFRLNNISENLFVPCLILVIINVAVFFQLPGYDFVNFDDNRYVYENDVVKNGISLQGIKLAFTTVHLSNWHPITWLSHMFDCQLFGLDAGMHHLTGLLIHIINCILLLVLLNTLSGELWKSFFVAVLFAIHPLHVESVAWISERKDVLSTMFLLLTIITYSFYTQTKSASRYLLTIFFFLLGGMAKPMVVTLPFILMLLDYWPLNRLRNQNVLKYKSNLNILIVEKIPFVIISLIMCVITILAQKDAVVKLDDIPIFMRIANAAVSYCAYLFSFIWPTNLSVFYPYPETIPALAIVASGLFIVSVSVFAWIKVKIYPYIFVGWFWYLGTLVPVIGIVQVGLQSRADRYTYIPLIGIFIIAVWGISFLWEKYRLSRIVFVLVAQLIIAMFALCSYWQVSYWKNSYTLFDHAVKVTNNNYIAYNNLGSHFGGMGTESIQYFLKAIEIKPDFVMAYNNLARAYLIEVKSQKSMNLRQEVSQVNFDSPIALNNIGLAFSMQDDFTEAIKHFQKAIEKDDSFTDAYINLGVTLAKLERYDEAIEYFGIAISKEPGNKLALQGMTNAVEDLNKLERD